MLAAILRSRILMFEEYRKDSTLVVMVGALKVRTDWIHRVRAGLPISIGKTNCKKSQMLQSCLRRVPTPIKNKKASLERGLLVRLKTCLFA